jgi:hypothetical protein
MKKQISTQQTDENIREVLRLLRETPEKIGALSRGLTARQLADPLGPGERSFTATLAHLLHCEAVTSQAIYLALLQHEPLLADVHAERDLGKLLRLDLLAFEELLSYFKMRRTILLRVLEILTPGQWSRVVRAQKKERRESVYWQARAQALHELEHLQDLETKLLQNSYK